jgi:hypothetical protein
MKTSELTGALLDYWVGRAEGLDKKPNVYVSNHPDRDSKFAQGGRFCWSPHTGALFVFRPSTDWAQGGPLIEKYSLDLFSGSNPPEPFCWAAYDGAEVHENGHTPLQAICRTVVRAAFGDEVGEVAVC